MTYKNEDDLLRRRDGAARLELYNFEYPLEAVGGNIPLPPKITVKQLEAIRKPLMSLFGGMPEPTIAIETLEHFNEDL